MNQIKEYLEVQLELLKSFDLPHHQERLRSLDQDFGIELLRRRQAKLTEKLSQFN
jgi:uncharacterized protein YigA (DUF484 family)